MDAFAVLADPVRRRILELLADGERSAGEIEDGLRADFALTQPAISRHLRVLREQGLAEVRAEGTRRLYTVRAGALDEVEGWLSRYHQLWSQRLDALDTEISRGRPRGRSTR
jgi:DNA-binding transcriptional ArsR family regulator